MRLPGPSPRWALGLAAGLIALAWSGTLALRHLQGSASVLDRIEATLLDLRFLLAGPRDPGSDLLVVAIDDRTVQEAGRYPLPRQTVARLIHQIARQEPRAIGVDILFLDQGVPEQDHDLADALRAAGAVVASAGLFPRSNDSRARGGSGVQLGGSLPAVERVLWPIDVVRQKLALGLVNISTDHAGTPRHAPLLFRTPDAIVPSFALRVAAAAAGADPVLTDETIAIGPVTIRTDLGLSLPLRFYGPRGSLPTVSAQDLLSGADAAAQARGRVVIVGAAAVGTGDTFTTPFDPVLPGVEVLGTAVNHLLRGDGLVRDTWVRRIDAGAAVVLSTGAIAILLLLPLSLALALVGLAATGWLAFTVAAFASEYWFSAALPLVAMAPGAVLTTLGRQVLDRREARRHETAEAALRLFQPPLLVDRIAADPAYLAQPQEQEAAVVFIDLSRFTRLSERLGPARTRELLRDFHALVEDETNAAGGVVLSYMGDGAMMAFGLPEPRVDDAERALRACFALARHSQGWIAGVSSQLGADIDVRLGAHFGRVVVSRLGADTHQHITVTGDTVNVASRLLEVAAKGSATLVVSADLLHALGAALHEGPSLSDLRDVAIRGRSEPLRVALWRLEPPTDTEAADGPAAPRRM